MKVEILFSEVCNLFGDSWNAKYLEKCLEKEKIYYTSLLDTPKFVQEKIDFIYLGSMSENIQERVIEKLMPYKERIKELINDGCIFLMTGNAMEIMGKQIIDGNRKIKCLDIFDITSKRDYEHRYNSLVLGHFEKDIVGYKSQFSSSVINEQSLFDIKKEVNGATKEGIHVHNFFGTNLLGPILILNPYFTKYLLSLMGYKNKLPYEKELIDAYKVRVEEYKKDIKL